MTDPRDLLDTARTDLAAFLRAIRENPDDDTVRLVYADWLAEHGDEPRAEFIRVQLELATRNPAPMLPSNRAELDALRARERELFERAGPDQLEWLGAAHALAAPGSEWAGHLSWFRRGFLHRVTCPGDDWARHGGAVLAEHPVREVVVTESAEFVSLDGVGGAGWQLVADPAERVVAPSAVREAVRRLRGDWIAALDPGIVSLGILGAVWPGVTFRPAE